MEIFRRNFFKRQLHWVKLQKTVDADSENEPVDMDVYYIVADKCTECKGFHDEPQCAAVCPVDCCVPDEDMVENDEVLLTKKDSLHIN